MKTESEFKEFYEENFDRIFNYIYSRSPNFQDAEDISSEVFSAIWNSWENIEKEYALNFAFKVAKNKVSDFLRKQYKIYDFFEETSTDELAEEFLDKPNEKHKQKLKIILEEVLGSLNEREKFLFNLKYKENKTFTEISSEMNITKNNAKVMNNRLVKKFKELCQKTKI